MSKPDVERTWLIHDSVTELTARGYTDVTAESMLSNRIHSRMMYDMMGVLLDYQNGLSIDTLCAAELLAKEIERLHPL